MSGRIRTIKPELLEDAKTAALDDTAFRLFIAMFLLADDYGNLRAESKYLEGQIYWSTNPANDVRVSCESLESLVRFYEIRGQRYAHIRGWSKHQRVQHPGKPRVPAPPEESSGESHESLTNPPESLAPELRSPISDHRPPSAEQEPAAGAAAGYDLEILELARAIRAEPKLRSCCDPLEVATRAMPVGNRKPLAWMLAAVADAAAKTPPGEQAHVTLARLVGFLKHAKAPKVEEKPRKPPAHVDSDDRATVERIRRGPKRMAFNDPRAAAVVAKLGIGHSGAQAPPGPTSEADLAEKARRDRERLAELNLDEKKKAGSNV